jgi:glycerophosphoryl diester phosphodiesterase
MDNPEADQPILSDLQFLGECAAAPGMKYHIYGTGFKSGDKVQMKENTSGTVLEAATTVSDGHLIVTIPAGVGTGAYNLILVRGEATAPIGTVNITASSAPRRDTKVVAHRGAYKNTGAAQNSIASLKAVKPLGIYASELDVWITPDDVVVVNHDATFPTDSQNRYITDTNYSDMGDIRLSNGEAVPTFDEYVKTAKAEGIRLVVEIKTQRASANGSHTKQENNNRVVDASIAIVKKYDYESMCDWIAFDFGNCKRIAQALPTACVQYLNGDYAPAVCQSNGVNGIDYKMDKLPYSWVESAHGLGMVVNVWTVDSATDMLKYIGWGVDFLTTNQPELAKELTSKVFLED